MANKINLKASLRLPGLLCYILLLSQQGSLCDLKEPFSNAAILKAKKIVLNYMSLSPIGPLKEREFLDSQFVCALNIVSKSKDPDFALKLAQFSPKSWNTTSFLEKVEDYVYKSLKNSSAFDEFKKQTYATHSWFSSFEQNIHKLKTRTLSSEELEDLVSSISSYDYFVTYKLIDKLLKANAFFPNLLNLLKLLKSKEYFKNKFDYYRLFFKVFSTSCFANKICAGLEDEEAFELIQYGSFFLEASELTQLMKMLPEAELTRLKDSDNLMHLTLNSRILAVLDGLDWTTLKQKLLTSGQTKPLKLLLLYNLGLIAPETEILRIAVSDLKPEETFALFLTARKKLLAFQGKLPKDKAELLLLLTFCNKKLKPPLTIPASLAIQLPTACLESESFKITKNIANLVLNYIEYKDQIFFARICPKDLGLSLVEDDVLGRDISYLENCEGSRELVSRLKNELKLPDLEPRDKALLEALRLGPTVIEQHVKALTDSELDLQQLIKDLTFFVPAVCLYPELKNFFKSMSNQVKPYRVVNFLRALGYQGENDRVFVNFSPQDIKEVVTYQCPF